VTFDLPPKFRRFLKIALREKIARMEAERNELCEDDAWQIDNDLPIYEAMLTELLRKPATPTTQGTTR
jgi:hypothetical protein